MPSTCHAAPRCNGSDGWITGPLLPAGSGCSTAEGPGLCDKQGSCIVTRTVSGSISPDYYLVTVIYAPPGNKSKASYYDGSTAGTTSSAATLLGAGIKVGITGNVIADVGYQATTQTSQSFQVNKTTKTELDINSVSDTLRHGQDVFYLWVNPQLNYSQEQSPGMPVNISLGTVGNAAMTIVPFTADEITKNAPVPPWKAPYFSKLTALDLQQIAMTDPWLQANYAPDPNRFVKVTELALDGPDNPGDDYPGQGALVDDSQVVCSTNTTSLQESADIGFSAGADFFGQGEKAIVVDTLTYRLTNSTGSCNGSSQRAVVDLATTTTGLHDVFDVYEDTVMHSFTYVSESQGAGFPTRLADITGTAADGTGRPLRHQLIELTFADGNTRKLFTNARGKYSVFNAPPGAVTIVSGDSKYTVKVVRGSPIVRSLIIHNSGPGPAEPTKPKVN